MAGFQPDPAFDAGSVLACDWPLSQVRIQDDARFPWLILIPRLDGVVELDELTADQRAVLMEETVRAGAVVRVLGLILCALAVQFIIVGLGEATNGFINLAASAPYGDGGH